MVGVEGRITGRGEEVGTRVTADGVVDATVRADLDSVGDAFGEQAVFGDVGLVEEL